MSTPATSATTPAPSAATLASSLQQANALAAKLKEQVAAREASVKQAHDLLTTKAEEIKALNQQLQDGDVQIHDLQDEITDNFTTLQDYTKLLDAQASQLSDVLASSTT